MVWALPRSIATTKGITIVFFSSAYLDVSVQRVRLPYNGITRSPVLGCPIRKSPDQQSFAPPRSLSQLITSFFASESQGILRTPFLTFLLSERYPKVLTYAMPPFEPPFQRLYSIFVSSSMSMNFTLLRAGKSPGNRTPLLFVVASLPPG